MSKISSERQIRQERFGDGHLTAMIKSGHILAILRRLAELREQMKAE